MRNGLEAETIRTSGNDASIHRRDGEAMTGASSLVRSLETLGVDVVFGIPGGAILPLYDPLMDSPSVRHILVRPQPLAFQPARGLDGWPSGGAAGAIEVLVGPYRLAGGWWRTGIRRDYYFAETRRGDWLWVYFDRERRAWFLQGGIA